MFSQRLPHLFLGILLLVGIGQPRSACAHGSLFAPQALRELWQQHTTDFRAILALTEHQDSQLRIITEQRRALLTEHRNLLLSFQEAYRAERGSLPGKVATPGTAAELRKQAADLLLTIQDREPQFLSEAKSLLTSEQLALVRTFAEKHADDESTAGSGGNLFRSPALRMIETARQLPADQYSNEVQQVWEAYQVRNGIPAELAASKKAQFLALFKQVRSLPVAEYELQRTALARDLEQLAINHIDLTDRLISTFLLTPLPELDSTAAPPSDTAPSP